MTIRHLKIFVTVAEMGKMRSAAERLHISQPSVSQAIREMEDYYGVQLFERLAQRIYITENGKNLLSYARHVVESFEQFEENAFCEAKKEIIRIGGSVSVGTVLLPKLLKQLKFEQKEAEIQVTVNNTAVIEKMIENNELDIAIVEGIVKNSRLVQKEIMEDELVLVAGKAHPFFNRASIQIEELEGQSFVSRENGSAERNQFEQYLLENQIKMKCTWVCSNTEAIKQAVLNGEGLAILSRMLIKKELKEEQFHVISVEGINIKRIIKMIYYENKYFNSTMQRFAEICKNFT